MIEIYRYVPHDLALDYCRLGWMWMADLGPIHGQYSCLMGWPCGCKLVEPYRVIRERKAAGGKGWEPP